MPRIINVDELVPEDIELRYKSQSYILPGDISTETTFELSRLLGEMALAEAEQTAAGELLLGTNGDKKAELAARKDLLKASDRTREVTLTVERVLLALLQERSPELKEMPFGAVGFRVVLTQILLKLGFGEVVEPDPTPTKPKKAPSVKTRRSTRS